MSQHTPGPWKAEHRAGVYFVIHGASGERILKINGGMMPTSHDARLIAAAPDMLAALKDARDFLGDGTVTLVNVNAAIAKAEGK